MHGRVIFDFAFAFQSYARALARCGFARAHCAKNEIALCVRFCAVSIKIYERSPRLGALSVFVRVGFKEIEFWNIIAINYAPPSHNTHINYG